MTDFVTLLISILMLVVNGIIIGIVAIGVYFFKRRLENQRLRQELAETLEVEIDKIFEILNPVGKYRSAIDPASEYPRIPTMIYYGLVSSGNIAKINLELQKQLYDLYTLNTENQLVEMHRLIPKIITMLKDFKCDNSGILSKKRWII